jgi:hypothetical protein
MADHPAPTPWTRDLHLCDACRRPFVAPVGVVETLGPGRYVVELSCTNCGWSEVSVHQDAALDALDRQLDHATSQIAAAADVLALATALESIDRFARALEDDLILPEDF